MVNGDHHVKLEMPAPNLKPHPFPVLPARTLFVKDKLGPEWIHVRNIDPRDISLTRRKGCLSLHAGIASLDDKMNEPAFTGQRQPDFKVTARCSMEFMPSQDGEEAGLIVRSNDDNHYEIAVSRQDGESEIIVRNRVKAYSAIVIRKPFAGGKVYLEISGQESQYQFAWSSDGKTWETLAASDSADLTKERAGGFTGTVIGLYATANGKESQNWADYEWFEMKPGEAPAPLVLSPRPTPTPMPAQEVWRIRAGGTDFTDSSGNHWAKDQGFFDGTTVEAEPQVTADKDSQLYQTERWGSDFSYVLPVQPGEYQVRLLFAEAYVKKPGERIFDVQINGNIVLKDFDILKEAGTMNHGIEKTFDHIRPEGLGNIRIVFKTKVQNAKVCAVEILKKH